MAGKHAKRIDAAEIKRAASGRWREIHCAAGLSADILDSGHHPCPKCGGTDRFRFTDLNGDGSILCNQCGRNIGDGLAALMWFRSDLAKLPEAIAFVGAQLGLGETNGHTGNGHVGPRKKQPANPEEHLEWRPWSDAAAKLFFCRAKKGVTVEALKAFGARLAVYRRRWQVVALPVRSPSGETVGWCIFEQGGGTLPAFHGRDKRPTQEKMLLTAGSKPGLIAPNEFFEPRMNTDEHGSKENSIRVHPRSSVAWKVEGPTDALAVWAVADTDHQSGIFTNSNGARQNVLQEWLPLVAGCDLRIIHDADQPGEAGAEKWVKACAPLPDTIVRNPKLTYPIEVSHGKDLRDWILEGHTFADLLALANATPPIAADALPPPAPIEDEADPHRLARLWLAEQPGPVLYWRSEYYRWSGRCYQRLADEQFASELSASIKREFDRLNLLDQEDGATCEDGGPKKCRQVTSAKLNNTRLAVNSLSIVPHAVEPPTVIDRPGSPPLAAGAYIAFQNGLVDLDALLAGKDLAEVLLPHNPRWFSTVVLPYDFDPAAAAPTWERTIHTNQEGDEKRIAILQEWAGYLLTRETNEQKFLILEGEGANGKSVFCAGLEAMLGLENVSHVPLENFGHRFALTSTLGKLANIVADCGEIDKVAEGFLKSFTTGDRMMFDRKNKPAIEATPTAKMMMATNNRPRFSDRSGGLWRRMILVPWRRAVGEAERIKGMDKPEWWQRSGELPGLFNWAVGGIARLREQGGFTRSELVEEGIEEYRVETNPARQFLLEHVAEKETWIACTELYGHYAEWCKTNGYHKINERNFGREVQRIFPNVDRKQYREGHRRHWRYLGICFEPEIFS